MVGAGVLGREGRGCTRSITGSVDFLTQPVIHPARRAMAPSDWECSTCHPHATLDRGKCRTGCKEEQYLNLVGYCVGE